MITTHGCCFAMLEGERLAAGIIDYEQAVPEDVEAAFRPEIPPFSETFSADLPAGLNFARHIFWREMMDPALMRRADAILGYPQFWGWRFSGAKVSEVSYFGCHSHLWRPLEHDFSSLAYSHGWHKKFPAFQRAGGIVGEARIAGRSIAIHNGVHDSNASLYYYRSPRPGELHTRLHRHLGHCLQSRLPVAGARSRPRHACQCHGRRAAGGDRPFHGRPGI